MSRVTDAEALEARNKLVSQLADEFEASGIEFTCGAVVMDFAQKRIIPLTEHWTPEMKLHKINNFWKLKRQTWYEMQRRVAPPTKEGK